jgi:hypothetical protein
MHTNAALRLLSALLLSGAVACGGDPSGSGDDDDSTSSSSSNSKGTTPIKTVKKDAGVKKDAKVADDEEEETDDTEDDGEEPVKDAGSRRPGSCEVDDDCAPPSGSGISCCDVPTSVCYTWRSTDTCPVSEPAMNMPEYN